MIKRYKLLLKCQRFKMMKKALKILNLLMKKREDKERIKLEKLLVLKIDKIFVKVN